MVWRYAYVPLICMVLLLAGGCRQQPDALKDGVVVSIQPLAWFAERVAGGRFPVSVMVPPGGNPHTYEPTPRQMAGLERAALFVKAGSGVEFELDWMPRILAFNPGIAVCNASAGVRFLPMAAGHDRAHGGEGGGRVDPHFWLDPLNGAVIAGNISRSLAAIDPDNAAAYHENAAVLVRELRLLDREIRSMLKDMPNRTFMVFHPAWGYYAHAYGLRQVAAEAQGKALTPRQLEAVVRKAEEEGVRVLFASPQFSSSQVEAIASTLGITVEVVDPLAFEYEENLLRFTRSLERGLR